MKIGILTQPLYTNYGGLLQAWALQRTLVEMGHEVIIINRVYGETNIPSWRKITRRIKHYLLEQLGKHQKFITVTDDLRNYSEKFILPFKENRYLGVSPLIKSNSELRKYVQNEDFDAYVVGSDQVWRPMYSPHLMTYFLDFVKDNKKVKKIAYAASFGVDCWEYTKQETKCARELASRFDLITVRESSAISLVEKFLKCKAYHVLDPTMLRPIDDYVSLVENSTSPLQDSNGDLFCYVLDDNELIGQIVDNCAKETGYKPYYCNNFKKINELRITDNKNDCVVPPLEQWIKSFIDAKMILTDSFHGTVFSILFNKPFWVISNQNRGKARFISLLKIFGLEKRIITGSKQEIWTSDIDWPGINVIREKLSNMSKEMLRASLNF